MTLHDLIMQILVYLSQSLKTIDKYWQGKTNSCHLSLSPLSNRMKSDNKSMGAKNESMTEDITSASASISHITEVSSNYTQVHNSYVHYKHFDRDKV